MGRAKGLLTAPPSSSFGGERLTLVERLIEVSRRVVGENWILVGRRPEYEHLGYKTLTDAEQEAGPLAGLLTLMRHAKQDGYDAVIALACDLPYLSVELLSKLVLVQSEAQVVCPKSGSKFEPLFARYRISSLELCEQALFAQKLGLQPLIRQLGSFELELQDEERSLLIDWDSPEDLHEE